MTANDGSVEAMRRYVDVDVDQRDGRDAYLILNNNNELKECLVGCDAFSSCVIQGEKSTAHLSFDN